MVVKNTAFILRNFMEKHGGMLTGSLEIIDTASVDSIWNFKDYGFTQ